MKKVTGSVKLNIRFSFFFTFISLFFLISQSDLFAQCSTTISSSPMNWSATTGWTCTPAPNTNGHTGTWGAYQVNGLDGSESLNVDINLTLTSPLTLSGSRGTQAVFTVKSGKTLSLNAFNVGSNIKIVVESEATLSLTGEFRGGSNVTIENYGTITSTNLLDLADGSVIDVKSGASMYFRGTVSVAANFSLIVSGEFETPSNVVLGTNGFVTLNSGSIKSNAFHGGNNVVFSGPGTMEGTDFSFGPGAVCGSTGCPYIYFNSCRDENSEPCNSYCNPGEVEKGNMTAAGSTTICSGSSIPVLTLNDYTGAVIRWEYSVSPFTTWTAISHTSDSYPSSAVTLTETTQFRAVLTGTLHSRCKVNTDAITITVNSSSPIWTGAVNNDWGNTGNWCAGAVPTISQDVVIPSAVNEPIIKSSVNAQCKTLTIDASASLTIEDGTLTVGDGTLMNGVATINGEIKIANSSAQAIFNGNFIFNGTWNETAAGSIVFNSNATFNNAITTSSSLTVKNSGIFAFPASGNIVIENNGLLTLEANASYIGASKNSFVDGRMRKITTSATNFVFPVGKDTLFRQVGVFPETSVPTTFTAQYFDSDATAARTNKEGSGLAVISSQEYWLLEKSAGAKARVTLYWGQTSSVSENGDLNDLRVAHYSEDENVWQNMGGEVTNGSTWVRGSLTTSGYLSSFSPFTVSSTSVMHTLPVQIEQFSVVERGEEVLITWQANPAENLKGFEVQRSSDKLKTFEAIGFFQAENVSGKMNYSFVDKNPSTGNLYYRLIKQDINGKSNYSQIVFLNKKPKAIARGIYPVPTTGNVTLLNAELESDDVVDYTIINAHGNNCAGRKRVSISSINNALSEDVLKLKNGTYSIIILSDSGQHVFKVVKI